MHQGQRSSARREPRKPFLRNRGVQAADREPRNRVYIALVHRGRGRYKIDIAFTSYYKMHLTMQDGALEMQSRRWRL